MQNSRRGDAAPRATGTCATPRWRAFVGSLGGQSDGFPSAAAAAPFLRGRGRGGGVGCALPSIRGVPRDGFSVTTSKTVCAVPTSFLRDDDADGPMERGQQGSEQSALCSRSGSSASLGSFLDGWRGAAQLAKWERRSRRLLIATEAKRRGDVTKVAASALPREAAPPLSDQEREDEEEERQWLMDYTHSQSLVTAAKFPEAYVATSAALARFKASEMCQMLLRAQRAACSYALMNYKECAADCALVLRAWERRSAGERQDREVAEAAPVDLVAVGTLAAHAHLMREDYEKAEALYASMLGDGASGAAAPLLRRPSLSSVQRALLVRERAALPAVQRFRECVSREQWQPAWDALQEARALVEDTPLRVLAAMTLLEVGAVDEARDLLLPYVPTIPTPQPSTAPESLSGGDDVSAVRTAAEQRLLRCNVDAHYLLSTALLAKISAYSGRAYMNIAAVLLKRCLLVNASYAPAVALGDYLVRLEDAFALADTCERGGDHQRAVRVLSEALELDPANRRLTAALFLRRAEAHFALGRPLLAIDDCTQSLCRDATTCATAAQAYYLRARARQQTHREAEAASDFAMATRLNPSLGSEPFHGRRTTPHPPSPAHPTGSSPRPASRPFPTARTSAARTGAKGSIPQRTASATASGSASATPAPTLYDFLGVPVGASEAEIRSSFRRLTLLCHPDRLVTASEEVQMRAVEVFKKINNAHSILTDDARRRAYDATLPPPPP